MKEILLMIINAKNSHLSITNNAQGAKLLIDAKRIDSFFPWLTKLEIDLREIA
jgi:hypothetical protein